MKINIKEQARKLTWKYFIRYKIIESSIVIIGALIVYLVYTYRDWFTKNQDLIVNIIIWIAAIFVIIIIWIAAIFVIILIIIWIIICNWRAAKERAEKELKIGY